MTTMARGENRACWITTAVGRCWMGQMAAHSCGAWEKSIFIAQGVMVLMKSCILPSHVVHLDGVAHLAINGYTLSDHADKRSLSAKNDDDLQALNKFAGSKCFCARKCGRKCSKYPIFATFLTNLQAKIGRKYLRAYLRAKTAPEKHPKIPTFATSEVANMPPRFFDRIFPHRALRSPLHPPRASFVFIDGHYAWW